MIANIIDLRSDPKNPECDALYQPSAAHGAVRGDGTPYFDIADAVISSSYFEQLRTGDTTVRAAILEADMQFDFPVTVTFYDKGALISALPDEIVDALRETASSRSS